MTNSETLAFWHAPNLLALPHIAHGVTERGGGISSSPYHSLNLGLHVGDAVESVRENRRRAVAALGFSLKHLVCAEQIHGNRVARVTEAEAGRGATDTATALPQTDALISNTPGLLLGLYFADCLPIFFVDTERYAVGLAHAGWRGLASGVVQNTVAAMQQEFRTDPATLKAAVGPGIGVRHFEVGPEVAAHFPEETSYPQRQNDHPSHRLAQESFRLSGRPHVDLFSVARRQLQNAGLCQDNITVSLLCTVEDEQRWYSHRRDRGTTGRMGAFIGLRATTGF